VDRLRALLEQRPRARSVALQAPSPLATSQYVGLMDTALVFGRSRLPKLRLSPQSEQVVASRLPSSCGTLRGPDAGNPAIQVSINLLFYERCDCTPKSPVFRGFRGPIFEGDL
jgi:hypothetical protein